MKIENLKVGKIYFIWRLVFGRQHYIFYKIDRIDFKKRKIYVKESFFSFEIDDSRGNYLYKKYI